MSSTTPKLFSHLYIEKRVLTHPKAMAIIEKFPHASIIPINHYKEVFNRPGQDIAIQSNSKKLILAHREGKFLHEGSAYSDDFGFERFFYASTIMGCLYDCDYCYLQGLYPSANTVVFVNLEDAFNDLIPLLDRPTLVATSYDTDTMALESLTHQSQDWIEFAYTHPNLHLEIRTKSANIKPFRSIDPMERVCLAWTLSPQEIINRYERLTPSLSRRIEAIKEAIKLGWRVRICIDPVIYTECFHELYPTLIETIFTTIDPNNIEELTLGSFRMSASHLKGLKKLRRSDVAFYPYDVHNEVATYPISIEEEILNTLFPLAKQYLPQTRIRTWQRQS